MRSSSFVLMYLAFTGAGQRLQISKDAGNAQSLAELRELHADGKTAEPHPLGSLAKLFLAFNLVAGSHSHHTLQQSCDKRLQAGTRVPASAMQFGKGAKLEAATQAAKKRLRKAEVDVKETARAQQAADKRLAKLEAAFEKAKAAFEKASEEKISAKNLVDEAVNAKQQADIERDEAEQAVEDARKEELTFFEENPLEAAGNVGVKVSAAVAGELSTGLLTAVFGESKSAREAREARQKAAKDQEKDEEKAERKQKAQENQEDEQKEHNSQKRDVRRAEMTDEEKAQREILAEARKVERELRRKRKQEEKRLQEATDYEEVVEAKEELETSGGGEATQVQAELPAVGKAESSNTTEERQVMTSEERSQELRRKREEAKILARQRRGRTLTDSIATGAMEGILDVAGVGDNPLASWAAAQKEQLQKEAEEEERRNRAALFESDLAVFGFSVDDALTLNRSRIAAAYRKAIRWSHPDMQRVWEKDPDRPKDYPKIEEISAAYDVVCQLVKGQVPGLTDPDGREALKKRQDIVDATQQRISKMAEEKERLDSEEEKQQKAGTKRGEEKELEESNERRKT